MNGPHQCPSAGAGATLPDTPHDCISHTTNHCHMTFMDSLLYFSSCGSVVKTGPGMSLSCDTFDVANLGVKQE